MTTRSYRQFCPVAMVAETLCPPWTIVLLRELVAGSPSSRFNELQRCVPRMPPSQLAQHLEDFEVTGIVARGPRASFATSEYMRTYFGVTPAESTRSGLGAYSPGGGIKGAGLEVSGRYELTEQWALVGLAYYERLIGDAAASPIVKAGNENQVTAKLGLSYKFRLKLFDD